MTILSFPVTEPDGPAPFRNRPVSQRYVSPVGGWTQTKGTPGSTFWQASVSFYKFEYEPIADELESFAGRLGGMSNRVYYGDPWYLVRGPRGPVSGTPLVKGAGQSGLALTLDGATPSLSPWIANGDYIAWDEGQDYRELHRVVTAASSDATGEVTVNIVPPIRRSPADNAPLIVVGATCVMGLAADDAFELVRDQVGDLRASFDLVEYPLGNSLS